MSAQMPRLSMIVPVYKAEQYLEAGTTALLSQTFSDFELILVDDGSPDNSGAMCDALAEKDPRVRVIHQQNGGAGAARNAGIAAARGEYLMFPDADDLCLPDMAQTLLCAAEQRNADVVVCGYQCFDGSHDGERVSPDADWFGDKEAVRCFIRRYFPLGLAGYAWNKLFRRRLIADNQLRFPAMRRYEDGVFLLSVLTRANSICVLPDVLYRYRVNNLAGLFQKFPPDNFQLLHTLVDGYTRWLDEQGLWDKQVEGALFPFFLNETVGSMDCMFSPTWGMNHRGRMAYLRELSADELVQRAAAANLPLGAYADRVICLLVSRHYWRLLYLMWAKMMLKKYGNTLFHRLKAASERKQECA